MCGRVLSVRVLGDLVVDGERMQLSDHHPGMFELESDRP